MNNQSKLNFDVYFLVDYLCNLGRFLKELSFWKTEVK